MSEIGNMKIGGGVNLIPRPDLKCKECGCLEWIPMYRIRRALDVNLEKVKLTPVQTGFKCANCNKTGEEINGRG